MRRETNSRAVPATANRRAFLGTSICLAAGSGLATTLSATATGADSKPQKFKAAIIGHTGKGDFGHEHDLIFNNRENIEVAAVADPVPAGRAKVAQRSHAARQYSDYREMLEKEKPQLVCVALRWTDQHHPMIKAALQAGAHVYSEKPFTQALWEADDLLATADRMGRKIVVAHQMRLAPNVQHLKKALQDGVIGELLEIRAHGKQDNRAGGEDMIVLGTHLFDLIRFSAGDVLWCAARVLQHGRDITRSDARSATENIGLIAGNEIHAQFALSHGVNASFTSRAKLRQTAGPWGLELIGSKGVIRILTEVVPKIFLAKTADWTASGKTIEWRPLPDDPTLKWSAAESAFGPANGRLVDDWLDAIQKNREPIASGHGAMKSIEMVMAVYEAALSGSRVLLPLAKRTHPLQS
ncbi:MAG: Gfo/Idh/MocA family oxidoreductase [Verrucomicrobia bacterium]|nr:Gfo/Idh/MocA family oxidoreductase [Verrucomicrobiota bacterium]